MTEQAEPPTTEQIVNPVLPGDFSEAKSTFNQARQQMGLDKQEAATEPPADAIAGSEASDKVEADAEVVPDLKASALPDDVLNPPGKDEPKEKDVISEIDAFELPKSAKEKQITDFNKLKSKAKEELTKYKQKVQDLEERIGKSTSNGEIEKLNEKLKNAETKAAEIEDQWAKTSLETSPRFQNKFIKREQAEIEAAKAYLEGTEVDPRLVEYAARTHGATRVKVLTEAGLTPELIASVNAHLAVYDGIQRDKQGAIENWKGESAKWQEQEAAKQQAEAQQRSEQENKVWENVLSKNNDLLPFRPSKDDKWNSRANELRGRAKAIFNGNGADLPTMAETIQKGVAYDALSEVVSQLVESNKQLREQNSKLMSSTPGGSITQTNGEVSNKVPASREELSRSTFNEQMTKARGG